MYYTERLSWIRNGVNVMPITYLIKICKYLNVSADYILGFTDEMKEIEQKKKESEDL